MDDMIPLSVLQRHYQRLLNKCVACDDTTGRLLSRHRDLLRVVPANISGIGIMLVPAFLLPTSPADCGERLVPRPAIRFTSETPWNSILTSEVHRLGLRDYTTAYRHLSPYQREAQAQMVFSALLTNHPHPPEPDINDWLRTNPEHHRLVDEYLFFAFYDQWRDIPKYAQVARGSVLSGQRPASG
ncbi:TPA: hypothetical protein N1415_003048 [Salmonella enterica subsp. enterica serovar 4,[5],12:i:-]|nr:hypothetical protein [Salmonella enterica]ECR8416794.1 hypothetical protein [Salmonella enterica]HCL1641425.1 hypothetical protein [Salmonella enterica subsp. enterica serovar 4,[5],12:i:-]